MAFPLIPRHSTTLMLAVRNQQTNQHARTLEGFKLLMVQRSSNMKFMPNRYVFPGGISETTDFSPDWLDIIHDTHVSIKPSIASTPFYSSYFDNLPINGLPAHIGFRICALRETFEECGILLVRSLLDNEHGNSIRLVSDILSPKEILSWREKVHNNSSLFLELCRNIKCAPDIWSLYEWSNWITPTSQFFRRFTTMFYLAFLDNEPGYISDDGMEVTNYIWIDPLTIPQNITLSLQMNIAPPQLYELLRLCRFSCMDDLKMFVGELDGVVIVEPVSVQSSSGDSIYFFPGDEMYEEAKCNTYKHYANHVKTTPIEQLQKILPPLKLSQSTEDLLRRSCGSKNRLLWNMKKGLYYMDCNALLKYNMPTPVHVAITAKL